MSNVTPSSIRRRYPSDLSDDRWLAISALMPPPKAVGRPRARAVREIVDAINYHWETGCAWRMLPHDFPPWGTVYAYFRKWRRLGVLQPVREELLRPAGRPAKSQRRNPSPRPRGFQNPHVVPTTDGSVGGR